MTRTMLEKISKIKKIGTFKVRISIFPVFVAYIVLAKIEKHQILKFIVRTIKGYLLKFLSKFVEIGQLKLKIYFQPV